MSLLAKTLQTRLRRRLSMAPAAVAAAPARRLFGRVERAGGLTVHARLARAAIGDFVRLAEPDGGEGGERLAQVVGFDQGRAVLAALGDLTGLTAETLVAPHPAGARTEVGDHLLGRVLDGLGRPLDGGGRDVENDAPAVTRPVLAPAPPPLSRPPIDAVLPTGTPAIDAFLTLGRGQRIGLFGEPGLGKSRLMADLVRGAAADVAVVALVGERGREVAEFIDDALGPEGLARSVIVAATSDRSPVEQTRAPFVATAIAEHFRDQGRDVLLVLDSLTRLARAQRELGLAAGETPARRGFPPSVFRLLPGLVERAGRTDRGSITAVYTTLVEGDGGVDDPVAEEARSLLDGHIVLSRRLAEAGRFPAIDVLASRSRLMDRVASRAHVAAAARLRGLIAKRREIELLVSLGEHRPGADAEADEALAKADAIEALVRPGSAARDGGGRDGGGRDEGFDALVGRLTRLAEREGTE